MMLAPYRSSGMYYLLSGTRVVGYYCLPDRSYKTAIERERGHWMLNTIEWADLLASGLRKRGAQVSWLELLINTGTSQQNAVEMQTEDTSYVTWQSW